MADVKMLTCVGVIFQFNSNGVLFEFTESGEDYIGFVKLTEIKVNQNSYMPESATDTIEKISKYLQIGDEIRCTVKNNPDLPAYEYVEDDDEVDESGNIKTVSKMVNVKPEWVATLAELVVPVSVDNEDKEDEASFNVILNLDESEQLDYDGFVEDNEAEQDGVDVDSKEGNHDEEADAVNGEKEEEMENGDTEKTEGDEADGPEDRVMDFDDVILFEDVDLSDFEEGKKKAAAAESLAEEKKKVSEAERLAEEKKKVAAAELQKIESSKTVVEDKSKEAVTAPEVKPATTAQFETFTEKARIVQLKKPIRANMKTNQAYIEVLTGPFAKRRVLVDSNRIFVFGHSLASTSLTNHLSYGDECTIEYRVIEPKKNDILAPGQAKEATLIATKVWFGSAKIPSNDDQDFSQWLLDKNIDKQKFTSWVRNYVPVKPYFAFPDETYQSTVVGYVREREDSLKASGLFLKVSNLISSADHTRMPDKEEDEGMKEEWPPGTENENGVKCKIALLLREDFYVCGVAALQCDLRLLLKSGESVACQIQPLTPTEKSFLNRELSQAPEQCNVTHFAYFGYVGPKRPQSATLAPADAPHLEQYLKSKDLTLQDFELIRVEKPQPTPPKSGPFPTQGMPSGVPPLFMGPHPPVGSFSPFCQSLPPPIPPGQFPGVFGVFFPQIPVHQITVATTIAAKAVNFPVPPSDANLMTILENQMELEMAVNLVKNLSQALILQMRRNIQAKISSSADELQSNLLQVRTAEQVLLRTSDGQQQMMMPKMAQLQEKLKEVQTQMMKEAEAAKAAVVETGKSKPVLRDARKILESFKAAKAKEEEKKELNPIGVLREFVVGKKDITREDDNIWFGTIGFPKNVKTNFKASLSNFYYNLNSVVHCIEYRPNVDKYQEYVQAARKLQIVPIFKADIAAIIEYLTDMNARKPSNLLDISYKELNPQLFKDMNPKAKVEEWKDKYVKSHNKIPSNKQQSTEPSKLSKMNDLELIAQAQLQMQMMAETAEPPKDKKRSRFDVPPPASVGLDPIPVVMAAGQVTVLPPFSANLNQPSPHVSLQPPPPTSYAMQSQQQTFINPFAPPVQPQLAPKVEPPKEQPLGSAWTESGRTRHEDIYRGRSPTLERMQETCRLRSPIRSRSPIRKDRGLSQTNEIIDPFRASRSPPRSSGGGGGAAAGYSDPRLRDEELQAKLWEEFKLEREARRRREDTEELNRLRSRNDDFEVIRQREAEIERLRLLQREEQLKREEEERKRKSIEDNELMWRIHVEKKLKQQQESQRLTLDEDFRRRLDYQLSTSVPPPPKIDIPSIPQLHDHATTKIPERRVAPPPPILSVRGQQLQQSLEPAKASWETGPSQARLDEGRGEWQGLADRSERKSWSREREWAAMTNPFSTSTSSQRDVESDAAVRLSNDRWASRSSSSGPSSYDRRF